MTTKLTTRPTHYRDLIGVGCYRSERPETYVTRVEVTLDGRLVCDFTRYSATGTWHLGHEAWLPAEVNTLATHTIFGEPRPDATDLDAMVAAVERAFEIAERHGMGRRSRDEVIRDGLAEIAAERWADEARAAAIAAGETEGEADFLAGFAFGFNYAPGWGWRSKPEAWLRGYRAGRDFFTKPAPKKEAAA